MRTDRITLRMPDDFHVHLRDGDMLKTVIGHTAALFRRALIMPNRPVVLTAADVVAYRGKILAAAADAGHPSFEPLMTVMITDQTTSETIVEARQAGAIAGKVYPVGVTNSDRGVSDLMAIAPVLEAMAEAGMVLCIHGESSDPRSHCLNAESLFLPVLCRLAEEFPRLKIVLEHVTTKEAVACVRDLPETVAATITAHHLLLTFQDVMSDKVRPHLFCKPVPKFEEDQRALVKAAVSGESKFFFGSDSAPHARLNKEGIEGAPGVFSAPVTLALLADLFVRHGVPGQLEHFVASSGALFYNLPFNRQTITLVWEPWTVPDAYDNVVPFKAGETLPWHVA